MTNVYLSVREAAEFLKMSRSNLYKLVEGRRLPVYRPFGRKLLFDLRDLETIIKAGRQSTNDELETEAATMTATR